MMLKNYGELISICIPVHLNSQKDMNYLGYCLKSITAQDYSNFEVILSDDLGNLNRLDINSILKKVPFKILKNKSQGISSNLNYAINYSRGKLVKIMFQDDFFVTNDSLSYSYKALITSSSKWFCSSSCTADEKSNLSNKVFNPRISDKLLDGFNTISSPSVITLYKDAFEPFSDKLNYLMDVEWYIRMSHRHGLPKFGMRLNIANRIHPGQATNWAKDNLVYESSIANEMHDVKKMASLFCKCIGN